MGCLAVGFILPMTAGAEAVTELGQTEAVEFSGVRLDCPGDPCWSQLPTWENGGASHDESFYYPGDPSCPIVGEMADDFPGPCVITAVRFWSIAPSGFTTCPDMRVVIWNNSASGCVPGAMACEYAGAATCEEVTGYPGYPSYEHCVVLDEPCDMPDGGWITCQALYCRTYGPSAGQFFWAMHTYPINGCPNMIRSVYFGYPDWTSSTNWLGTTYDSSFELLTGVTGTENSSWGEIKQMYR